MKVLLAGSTGAIGHLLLPLLVKAGHSVIAMTRSESRLEILHSQGAEPLLCDVFDQGQLLKSLNNTRINAVIHQLTSIPGRMNPKNIKSEMAPTGRYVDYIMNQQRGASNAKAQKQLNWIPHYPSWREGFTAEFPGNAI
jgi:NADPH:quinone reductase-like Zn-dependent oxidoreductase